MTLDAAGSAAGSGAAAGASVMEFAAAGAASGSGASAEASVAEYAAFGAAAGTGQARGFIFRILTTAAGAASGFGTASGDVTLYPFVLCPPIRRTRSACSPVIRDPDNLIVGNCQRPRGGTKTAGVPIFTPSVTNPTDNEFLPGS
jgi:hypothetical protein